MSCLSCSFSRIGNRERRGLAGAGAGLADDVDFLQRKRNQARLNGRGILVGGLLEGVEHDVGEAEAFEGGLGGRARPSKWSFPETG